MKVGKFELTDDRRLEFRGELEKLLEENDHLTLKNFIHKKSLAKTLTDYLEEKIALAFEEVETGYQPAPHRDFPDLTPRQLKTKNTKAKIIANATGGVNIKE